MYRRFLKRSFDLLLSLIVLFIVSPLLVAVIISLTIANRGNPFFFQQRPGKHCRIFRIIKFKTMNDRRDPAGNLLPDADRLTPIGSLIRKTSIDELPQLINVIKGDMSLVGPRPLLPAYLPLYNSRQMMRHKVRPGVTGWAQINGRNALSWEEKFAYDIYYVQNLSPSLDLKICLKTIQKVFLSEGISSTGQATMEPFRGNTI